MRRTVSGTRERPRLIVFRSNRYVFAQLIDDATGTTLAAADSRAVKGENGVERAKAVGALIALQAKGHRIASAVFDRGGFLYAGKVRAVAEGAREGGLAL